MKINQRYHLMSLQKKVRLICMFMMGVCMLLSFGIFFLMLQIKMESTIIEKEDSNRTAISDSYFQSVNNVNRMSRSLMSQKGVVEYLNSKEVSAYKVKRAVQDVFNTMNIFELSSYVTIFRQDQKYVNTGSGIMHINMENVFRNDWLYEVKEKRGGYVLKANSEQTFRTRKDRLITFARMVYDINSQKEIGLLTINLPNTFFETAYSNLVDDNCQVAFYDMNYNMLASSDPEFFSDEVGTKLHDGQKITKGIFQKSVLTAKQIPGTNFILVTYSKVDIWNGIQSSMALGILVSILFIIICLFLIDRYIMKNITLPIQKLATSMSKVEDGWLYRVSMDVNNDEIGQLKNSYNGMLVQINQLIDQLLQKERNLQRAELEALQEQIKPHFLYNTLETIRYFALEKQSDKVSEMLETLGNFYRRFLSKGSPDISIMEEIEIVKSYLSLQKNRYEDVFVDEYEIEDGVETIHVPRLILQPFVENSIYHGVRLKGEKGLIRITAKRKGQELHVSIFDTGVGMSKEKIKSLVEKSETRSFGVKGTIERIQYYYNKEDVFEIHSTQGAYCEVILKLPIVRGINNV